MNSIDLIRKYSVAGMFYEESSDLLSIEIKKMLDNVKTAERIQNIKAIIVPHAGYIYSGQTAAYAYKQIEGNKYDCVIIVGPSHREYFDGISVFNGNAYSTPFGNVNINNKIKTELLKVEKTFLNSIKGHDLEHSIEVQLPFLQKVLGEFTFVPIIMGNQSKELYLKLANALAKIASNNNVLLVASSDLSHYHSYRQAIEIDTKFIKELQRMDADNLISGLENEAYEVCGGVPVCAVINACKQIGANKCNILHYCNSGDVSNDKSRVVGYVSAAIC